MFSKRIVVCLMFVFLATLSGAATTGNIRGVVSDSEGNPLPGATVMINSVSLIGSSRTVYTSDLGVFRFPSLPVGTYSVQVSMEEFETIHVNTVEVSLNATANVPVNLKIAKMTQSMTIVGESPLLDVTDSSFSSSYKNEMLREVPTQRTSWDLIQLSPGMSPATGDSFIGGRTIAFGSNVQSNAWNMDGLDVSGALTGSAAWWSNPDIFEEIQVMGIGTPAEYGNHSGGVFNMVSKKGGNDLHGSADFYYETDALTDVNAQYLGDPFHRDLYRRVSAQTGGPISKDRVWFFGAFEHLRDAYSQPGNDPDLPYDFHSDNFDVKISARLGEKHETNGFVHDNFLYLLPFPDPDIEPSATLTESGSLPAWGGSLISTLTQNLLLELNYAGWWIGDDLLDSATGSRDEPFFDSSGKASGGLSFPRDIAWGKHTFGGKITYYADQFLRSQHEFRFGVQYSDGWTDVNAAIGPNGTFSFIYYGTRYQAIREPYQYGGFAHDLGFFVDDTLTISDRLTLNLGLRFDHNTGGIPDYERLTVGTPTVSPAGNFKATGENIPGVPDLIEWNLLSPRLGFVYQTDNDRRSIIQGSFGIYYDHNVAGNWAYPPPDIPPFRVFREDPETGELEFQYEILDDIAFNKNLRPPRTLQYSAGYERQLSESVVVSTQYVYKDTKDLIGWEILGGTWETDTLVDPFTGRTYTVLRPVEPPTLQKGNDPGDFPGSEGLRYFQKYHGLILTFEKRFSDHWGLNASYTWSKSNGLLPTPLFQTQGEPLSLCCQGQSPNDFINAEGRLQGDRPHMFRLQAVFQKLPGDIQASASLDFSSGRHHTRRFSAVIVERGLRYPAVATIDLSIGKRIHLASASNLQMRLEGTIYNLLNSDAVLLYESQELQDPSQTFIPSLWTKPRRLQLRIGFQF